MAKGFLSNSSSVSTTTEGSGLGPKIVITGPTTGSKVIATNGETTVNGVESTNVWTPSGIKDIAWEIDIPSFGDWEVVTSLGSNVGSKTISVLVAKLIDEVINYSSTKFTITGPTSGSTVTATNGSLTVTGVENNGTWLIGVPNDPATWTITATRGNAIANGTIEVIDGTTEYSLVLEYPTIIKVTGPTSGSTVTATNNDTTVTGIESNGTWLVSVPDQSATWTINAVNGDATANEELTISTGTTEYSVEMYYPLQYNDWSTIAKVAEAGKGADYWSVGDRIQIPVNGTNYYFRIIGFNHDTKTDGTKKGITFKMDNAFNNVAMNTVNNNNSGWDVSLRNTLNSTYLSYLPSSLQSVIKTVKKKTGTATGNGVEIVTLNDKLFLLSYVEVGGSLNNVAPSGEGTIYSYYKNAGNARRQHGKSWWLRSPVINSETNYLCVKSDGSIKSDGIAASSTEAGVSFAFVV